MKRKVFDFVGQIIIPCAVLSFTIIYLLLTRKVVQEVAATPDSSTQSSGFFQAIFDSPEIVSMFKITIFYSVPIFVFMIFLYLLFAKIHRVTISLGNYKIDMEQDIASNTSSEAVEHYRIQMARIAEQVKDESQEILEHANDKFEELFVEQNEAFEKIMDQQSYYLEKLQEFGKALSERELDFPKAFKHLLIYFKELLCYKPANIRYAFYFIIEGRAYGYDLLGMSPVDTLKVREFLADLNTLKKSGFFNDLEQQYANIVTEFESDVIHSIIGSPIVLMNGEILGIILAYTRDERPVFSGMDLNILGLLCQYFGVALARMNLKDILIGMYNLEGFPLKPPADLSL